MKYIALGLLAWNIIVFFLYGIDKQKAKKGKWRINETTLLICTFLMGSVGAFFGMNVFRHKTNKWKFKIGVTLAILLNLAIIFLTAYLKKE
ncbi:MAG: DUF1294 domain-containing protein [Defluviitaleaceae bacterium]|nr:DUF1294 domain-containing protein [Defluviitaleaceae bacterium]